MNVKKVLPGIVLGLLFVVAFIFGLNPGSTSGQTTTPAAGQAVPTTTNPVVNVVQPTPVIGAPVVDVVKPGQVTTVPVVNVVQPVAPAEVIAQPAPVVKGSSEKKGEHSEGHKESHESGEHDDD